MKKFFVTVTGLFAGIVLAACMLAGCSSGKYSYSQARKFTAGSGSISDKAITEISVDWIGGKVSVIGVPDIDEITFTETTDETNENYFLHYAVIGGELEIKFQKSGTNKRKNFSKDLTVMIPSDVTFREIGIETVSGGINVSNVSASEIDLESVSGDIDVYRCSVTPKTESKSGSIVVDGNKIK